MRSAIAIALMFSSPLLAQMPPNQDFAPPSPNKPDEATLKAITAKTAELKKAVRILKPEPGANYREQSKWADIAVYLKAAEWIVRHGEWYTKDSGKQTLQVLEAGMKRAYAFENGGSPWRDIRGKPVIRGYIANDGSVQPYRVTLPEKFGPDNRKFRMDIVLHGRDASLTEVKFIAAAESAKTANAKLDTIILEVYGRGNNAYRWAGESDIFEAKQNFELFAFDRDQEDEKECVDDDRKVIRGFSMGGAGTWHIGLHHPVEFRAMAPGAGFTVTHGYIGKLPEKLPDYIERCLRIYDAADYAENLTIIPCVAYSGEIDPQMAAVKNIEARLKGFKDPVRFQHIIGTGLPHKMPPEWFAKVDEQLRKYLAPDAAVPQKWHFETFIPRYGTTPFGTILALEKQYEKAVIEGRSDEAATKFTTKNVRSLTLNHAAQAGQEIEIDGTKISFTGSPREVLTKEQGVWKAVDMRVQIPRKAAGVNAPLAAVPVIKRAKMQGPIDDAFMEAFYVIKPTGEAWNAGANGICESRLKEFSHNWDKYFRGELPMLSEEPPPGRIVGNAILFGDPGSNPVIAFALSALPLKWTKETLEVNGKTYDAKTHIPVMIYPHPTLVRGNAPRLRNRYIVINSGHTFGEADLKGTNALLYPRLGDWAVLKLAPTKEDPHHTEVVDAGIFDENWQFEKKK